MDVRNTSVTLMLLLILVNYVRWLVPFYRLLGLRHYSDKFARGKLAVLSVSPGSSTRNEEIDAVPNHPDLCPRLKSRRHR